MKEAMTNYIVQSTADSKRRTDEFLNQPQKPDHTFLYLLAGVAVVAMMIKVRLHLLSLGYERAY